MSRHGQDTPIGSTLCSREIHSHTGEGSSESSSVITHWLTTCINLRQMEAAVPQNVEIVVEMSISASNDSRREGFLSLVGKRRTLLPLRGQDNGAAALAMARSWVRFAIGRGGTWWERGAEIGDREADRRRHPRRRPPPEQLWSFIGPTNVTGLSLRAWSDARLQCF